MGHATQFDTQYSNRFSIMTSFRAAALLLSCMVACAAIPAARARVHQVQPFTTVTSCVPYNVQIIPGPRYTVAVDADADVEGALTANVTDKVLYLGSGAFNTSNPIVVNVTLPATALAGVVQGGGLASIFVAPGAKPLGLWGRSVVGTRCRAHRRAWVPGPPGPFCWHANRKNPCPHKPPTLPSPPPHPPLATHSPTHTHTLTHTHSLFRVQWLKPVGPGGPWSGRCGGERRQLLRGRSAERRVST